jgi:hypothetical protein
MASKSKSTWRQQLQEYRQQATEQYRFDAFHRTLREHELSNAGIQQSAISQCTAAIRTCCRAYIPIGIQRQMPFDSPLLQRARQLFLFSLVGCVLVGSMHIWHHDTHDHFDVDGLESGAAMNEIRSNAASTQDQMPAVSSPLHWVEPALHFVGVACMVMLTVSLFMCILASSAAAAKRQKT